MEFYLKPENPYHINQPELLPTPRLLMFQDRVEENIRRMRELLAGMDQNLGMDVLCPHVKTHKSSWVTRLLLQNGVTFFTASLNEVDMLVACRAPKIFVAYPLLPADARRIAVLMRETPATQFYVQIGNAAHAEILARTATEMGVQWRYFIDVNVGMDRTGLPIEESFDFFLSIRQTPFFDFAGLHAYDGHIQQKSVQERRTAAQQSITRLQKMVNHFGKHGVQVPHIMVAGTPGFLPDVEILSRARLPVQVLYSPGTWIYFDSATDEKMPGAFDYAAVILAQVMDKPTPQTATLNLGHKRWAVDSGPIDTFSVAGMRAVSWSEEHTVVNVPDGQALDIGDYVLFAPRHICPTVNLWEFFTVLNGNGEIVIPASPVDGRNR